MCSSLWCGTTPMRIFIIILSGFFSVSQIIITDSSQIGVNRRPCSTLWSSNKDDRNRWPCAVTHGCLFTRFDFTQYINLIILAYIHFTGFGIIIQAFDSNGIYGEFIFTGITPPDCCCLIPMGQERCFSRVTFLDKSNRILAG